MAFSDNVAVLRNSLIEQLASRGVVHSVVSITWAEAPELEVELDAVVDALAKAAFSVWPNWYSTPTARFDERDTVPRGLTRIVANAKAHGLPVSESWAKRVWSRCERGKLPKSEKISSAEQIRQLSLAIDLHRPILLVAILDSNVQTERLQVLSQTLAWMAAQAEAPLVFLAPSAWKQRSELDAISFEAWDADALASAPPEAAPVEGPAALHPEPSTNSATAGRAAPPSERVPSPPTSNTTPTPVPPLSVVVEPFFGKPHPNSRVESYLAKHLDADKELRALFSWNQPMPVLGTGCSVDLFWQAGGLVIEIDGPDHFTPHKYNADRLRDYKILLAGYTTLRITNDAINYDVAVVIEQIRKVVRHLQSKGIAKTHGTESQAGIGSLADAHG